MTYQAFRFILASKDKQEKGKAEIENVALKSICHQALDSDGDYKIFAVTTEEWQKAQEFQVSKFLQVDPELFVSLKEIQEKTYRILYPNKPMPTTDRSYGARNTAPANIESLVMTLMNKKDLILKDQNRQPIQLIPLNSDGMISTGKSKFELETAKGLSVKEFKNYMEKVTQLAKNTKELIFKDKEIQINNDIIKIDIKLYEGFKQWIREQYPQEKEHQALMRDFTTINGFKRIVQSTSGKDIDLLQEYLKSRKTKKA